MSIERDQTPRPWPFPSRLGAKPDEVTPEVEEPESDQCECDLELSMNELASGKCSACGRPVLV